MNDPDFIPNLIHQFQYYKQLAEQTFDQLSDEEIFWSYNEESNSVAILSKHIAGNAISRWTDFLTTDGEKEWRDRDQEFVANFNDRQEFVEYWNRGWESLFNALAELTNEDLEKIVYIRNMGHTVIEAINRQLAHYSYHIGQIVFIGKMLKGSDWKTLSIPKGNSTKYNATKFEQPKLRSHYTTAFRKKH